MSKHVTIQIDYSVTGSVYNLTIRFQALIDYWVRRLRYSFVPIPVFCYLVVYVLIDCKLTTMIDVFIVLIEYLDTGFIAR